jgi:hypothetical protein
VDVSACTAEPTSLLIMLSHTPIIAYQFKESCRGAMRGYPIPPEGPVTTVGKQLLRPDYDMPHGAHCAPASGMRASSGA